MPNNRQFAVFFSRCLILVSFVQLTLASCGLFEISHPFLDALRTPTAVVQLALMAWLTGWEFSRGDIQRGIIGVLITVSLGAGFVYLAQNGWVAPFKQV